MDEVAKAKSIPQLTPEKCQSKSFVNGATQRQILGELQAGQSNERPRNSEDLENDSLIRHFIRMSDT